MTRPAKNASSNVIPVILSGGSGTRLWPLSRPDHPKQLIDLLDDSSLLQQTILRFQNVPAALPSGKVRRWQDPVMFDLPYIVCNEKHIAAIEKQLRAVKSKAQNYIIEPVARGTATAIGVAAFEAAVKNPEQLILFLPSDHVIQDSAAFHIALRKALPAAQNGAIVMLGARPSAPETGFGYMLRGDPLKGAPGCYEVKQFLEKPNQIAAAYYVQEGTYFWNCGIFFGRADVFLAELKRWRPDIEKACSASLKKAKRNGMQIMLDKKELARAQEESFDKAVMEYTDHAAMVPAVMGWSDVGIWSTVWQVNEKDNGGNAGRGDVKFVESRNCYVHTSGAKVVTLGVENLVVVATDDAILVMPKDRSQDVRQVAKE